MADKYQYIRDEENEKLRKKLAAINKERNIAFVIAIIIACFCFAAIIYQDEIIAFID